MSQYIGQSSAGVAWVRLPVDSHSPADHQLLVPLTVEAERMHLTAEDGQSEDMFPGEAQWIHHSPIWDELDFPAQITPGMFS
jgi:hypothetical protein